MSFRMRWPTQYNNITQRFDENPQYYRKFGLPGHEGLDFAAPVGSEIYAVADGLVSDVRLDGFSDPLLRPYGNQVRTQHPGGYETIYAHLSEVLVVRGQTVKARQLIALGGSSGNSTGPHLHLSLKSYGATAAGKTPYPYDLVNPELYLETYEGMIGEMPTPPDEPTVQVEVVSPDDGYLNIRVAPYLRSERVTWVDHGTLLGALEPTSVVALKVGTDGHWLWVRTPEGVVGYAAAAYLALPLVEATEPDTLLVVDVEDLDGRLNLRAGPGTCYEELDRLPHGTGLRALEPPATVAEKVGREGAWLKVQTPKDQVGYVAAWYVALPDDGATVVLVVVARPDASLCLRAGPSTDHGILDRLPHGTTLKVLGDTEAVEQKIGRRDAWLKVQSPAGQVGYCAALYLRLMPFTDEPVIPEPEVGEPTRYVVVESPELGLRLRSGPGTDAERISWVPHKTVLTSLEDPWITGRKVGQRDTWIHVRTPARYEGYVAAWYVRHPEAEDKRRPATEESVPLGVSPHVFGIHALTVADDTHARDGIRNLYRGKDKRGWIQFTETIGHQPQNIKPNPKMRRRLWDWAEAGYGVIIGFNHGYEPGGTLPESCYYEDFAAAAARWVELNLKNPDRPSTTYAWTLQIGNEQNNPREHPGGFEQPIEHITPELYAAAFNHCYAQIKMTLPNAIVCPGAVDPYNYRVWRNMNNQRWRPLDYFTTMLAHIDELDGIILHAYTHGPDPTRLTHLKRFGDGTGPLADHYYDFQSYRLFLERVPAKWRDCPAYITEMNHIHRTSGDYDHGWVSQNVGWVRAAYEEIHRWNQRPYAQQIRCGLLYRWMWNDWSIENKPGILEDFGLALDRDYRWRRAPSGRPMAFTAPVLSPTAQPEELEERFLMHRDDLTCIGGLGEKAQVALNAAGIMIFEQLATMTADEVAALVGETGLRTRYLETWPEQAELAAAGDWEALERLRQDPSQG